MQSLTLPLSNFAHIYDSPTRSGTSLEHLCLYHTSTSWQSISSSFNALLYNLPDRILSSVKSSQSMIAWHSGQSACQNLVMMMTQERIWWWLGGAELKLRRDQASFRWEVFASIISWEINILGQNSDGGEVKSSYHPNPNLFLPGFGLGGGVGQPVQG